MTNILDFPMNSGIPYYLRKMREHLGDEVWARIGPVIEGMAARHGEMPSFNKTMDLSSCGDLTPEQCRAIVQVLKQELIAYGTLCRGPLMGELAAALIENDELKTRLAELKKT